MCSDKVGHVGGSGYVGYDPTDSGYDSEVSTGSESASEISDTLSTLGLDPGRPPSSVLAVQGDGRLEMPQPQPLGAYGGSTLTSNDWKQLEGMGLVRDYVPPSEDYLNLLQKLSQPPPPPPPLDRPLRLGVPMPGGHTADWTPTLKTLGERLERRVLNYGPNYRARIETELQAKIDRGAQLAKSLVDPNLSAPRPMDEQDVTDLMWFLQARGEVKTGTNNAPEITYTLPDPHGHIRASLDRTSSTTQGNLAYQRLSSHLEGFQKLGGSTATPRGVNLIPSREELNAANLDRVLPNGKETILYQRMGQDPNRQVNGYPSERLFIKPEDHGMWKSKSYKPDLGGPAREHLRFDNRHAAGHSAGFAGSLLRKATGNNSPEGSFKERIPSEPSKEYKALVAAAPSGFPFFLQALRQNNPDGDSSGIHVMRRNIDNIRFSLWQLPPTPKNEAFKTHLNAFWTNYLDGSNTLYDHPDLRVGKEIILQPDEV